MCLKRPERVSFVAILWRGVDVFCWVKPPIVGCIPKSFSMVFHVGHCLEALGISFAVMPITCACEGVLPKDKTFSIKDLKKSHIRRT